MAEIEVKVIDRVAPSISSSLQAIATQARSADSAVKKLQSQLNSMNAGALNVIMQASANATKALLQTSVAAQKLATEQQRTAAAASVAAAAQTKAVAALTQSATATQKLATEQQRTAVQTANASAASDKAALSALKLGQAQTQAAKATKSAASELLAYARAAAAAVGLGLGAGAVLNAADAYTVLQNKLQIVTTSQEQVNLLTEELFNLANKTRSSIEDTTTAFARFDRALKILGKSQDESLRLTETVNKALIVSGSTTAEASSALLQLSQAFNSGKLQGEEFKALAENMPIVLDAIAKATGKPINELKKMGSEGKITAKVLYDAFKLIEEQVDQKFAKTTETLDQSLTVLSNSAKKFFGELNQATGVTHGLSAAMNTLSKNMDTVMLITVPLGVAMLVSFGPALWGAITKATTAMKAFTLALAANPIGLLAVALSTVIAYFALFSDEINAGIDDVTTLADVFSVAFTSMSGLVDSVTNAISELWAWMFEDADDSLKKTTKSVEQATASWYDDYLLVFQTNRSGWAAVAEFVARSIDAVSGLVRGLAIFVSRVLNEMAESVRSAIPAAYNEIVSLIEKSTNFAIEALNKIRTALGQDKIELVNFSKVKEEGEFEFSNMGELWRKSLNEGFKSQGTSAEDALNQAFARAQQLSAERTNKTSTKLRQGGASELGPDTDSKLAKAAERRSLALSKINAELDNEINRMFELKDAREAQARFDQIEESLIQKRIKLSEDEANAIKEKIDVIQDAQEIQKKFDQLYEEATGPLKEYMATHEAANRLLAMGAISQDAYTRAIWKANEAYLDSIDPLRQINKDIKEQINLLQMSPNERDIQQQILQIMKEKGPLQAQEIEDLENKFRIVQMLNALATEESALLDDSVARRQKQFDQLVAIDKLMQNQKSGFTQDDALQALSRSETGQFLVASPEVMNAEIARLEQFHKHIDNMRKQDLISAQSASAAHVAIWNAQNNLRLQHAKTFFGVLEGLQNSSNKRIAKIGKAAAVINATINTYQAATAAYAALAGIPYVGPALGAAAAAAAIAAGMANVAAIKSQSTGFMTGGYTGNMPTNEVAGVVHGKEYVMDAETTSRIGIANLQALERGAASVRQNSTPNHTPKSVGNNQGASTTVNMRNINVLDPALVGEYLATPAGEQVFINTMRRNSDQVRQIIQNG